VSRDAGRGARDAGETSGPAFQCPVCGGNEAVPALTLVDRFAPPESRVPFPLARCRACGLLRLHPRPDDQTLREAYSASYAPHTRPGLSGRAKGLLERWSVRRMSNHFAEPKRVLDIGCATGDLLLAIRRAGNDAVTGVEPVEAAVTVARARGLDVRHGTIEDARFPSVRYDTIVLSHTLEHVPDPGATLREVRRVLAPGGSVIIWLPNVESFEARLLKSWWIGYDAPRHLTTFGVTTLTRALEASGLRVTRVTHEAIGVEWAWALRLWLRDRWPSTERVLRLLHPMTIVGATPLAALGALVRRSGRVRVIAERA
jgi:2-polyprenyl-3-methyl-5-hydroxy-6-metoxy-1,4-benzoquinol methylase